ncbi:MAG: NmrA/HSCARG family protein [Candidatus Kapaibacterium sp.]|jgi:uncharacterized protein YbjT (DUF2867 family)
MQNNKTIFVTGVTGNQGGAVARNLIASGFAVRGLTRSIASEKAHMLSNLGVKLVQGDLDRPDSYREYLEGVDGVFSVQSFDNGVEKEIKEGIALAELSLQMRVPHFIYSSTAGCDLNSGIPHWESKFKIENHVRELGLPYTILRPTSLFENYLIPQPRKQLLKGKLISPIDKEVVQLLVASEDIGRVAAKILMSPEEYRARTLTLASEVLDLSQIAQIFSQTMHREIRVGKLPAFITRLVMGKNLYAMFQWINTEGAALERLTIDHDVLTKQLSLAEWSALHFKPV